MHFVEGLVIFSLAILILHSLVFFNECLVLIKVLLTNFCSTFQHVIHFLVALFELFSFFTMIHSVRIEVCTKTIRFECQNFLRFWQWLRYFSQALLLSVFIPASLWLPFLSWFSMQWLTFWQRSSHSYRSACFFECLLFVLLLLPFQSFSLLSKLLLLSFLSNFS